MGRNPDLVAEKIYAWAGRPLLDKARQAMQLWEQENRQHKHGVFKYSLEKYSLTSEMVTEKFKPYIDRFGKYF